MLGAYVLDPGSRSYSLKKLSEVHLNHVMQPIKELIGSGKNQISFAAVDIPSAASYSGDDAAVTLRLKQIFAPRIEEEGLSEVFDEIEMPLMEVLLEMERRGVSVSTFPFSKRCRESLRRPWPRVKARSTRWRGKPSTSTRRSSSPRSFLQKSASKPVRKVENGLFHRRGCPDETGAGPPASRART